MKLKIVKGKADVYAGCVMSKHNLDLTSGCACGYIGPQGYCTYCYAKRWNRRELVEKEMPTNFIQQLKKLDIVFNDEVFLRIGKGTDPGYGSVLEKYNTVLLEEVLNSCLVAKVRPIVVTKLLGYRPKLAYLLKASRATLQYSLGDDLLELGASALKMSNKERIVQGKWYEKYGVNVVYRVVCDITRSLPKEYKILVKKKKKLLITPIRVQNKNDLKYPEDYMHFRGYYRPNFVHKSYRKMLLCGDLSDGTEMCGLCGVKL